MPGWIFYIVLNMSIASCVVIAVLFLIRLIKPIPRRYIYPLWALAFFRLIMPFTLSSGLSLFNFTGGLVKRLVDIETITRGAVYLPASIDIVMMNAVGAVEGYDPIVYKAESLRRIFAVSSVVWVIAAAGALIAVCLLYSFTC
jgi:beta-lactamase regulating signal transducer with metallopeptidase domain